jgi:hypothetical protein
MNVQTNPSLSDWNWCVLMLTQALLGAVSTNFRAVELDFENSKWIVRVALSEENEGDREEINDVCDDFSIFLDDIRDQLSSRAYARVDPDVFVSKGPIIRDAEAQSRWVFCMRET